MQETADMELLRQYVHRNSEEAFAALVTRHVNMVYSAALRKTGNAHAAEEITQAVFIILAKKADRLRNGTILSGWLYQTARLTSASFLRTEIRRARREQEAYVQSLSNETESGVWPEIAPLLEDAMGRLGEKERNAIALRFFEGKSFQEIGTAVGASENAAKKRVSHGLEKLRKFFSKRGVVSTTAIIAGAISANSVQAAPVGLTVTVAATAAKGSAIAASTLTLVKGTLKVMAWIKIKVACASAAALLVIASVPIVATLSALDSNLTKSDGREAKLERYEFQAAPVRYTYPPSKPQPAVEISSPRFPGEPLLSAEFSWQVGSNYPPASALRVAAADELGNEFDPVVQYFAVIEESEGRQYWVGEVPVFPRRGKEVHLHLLNNGSFLAEFKIPNPASGPHPDWIGQPLPVRATDGDLEITLAEFRTYQTSRETTEKQGRYPRTECVFNFRENNRDTVAWRPILFELADATGNHWSPSRSDAGNPYRAKVENGAVQIEFLGALWPGESAWKIRGEFKRVAEFPENELLRISKIQIPDAKEVSEPLTQYDWNGASVELAAVIGTDVVRDTLLANTGTLSREEGMRRGRLVNSERRRGCITVVLAGEILSRNRRLTFVGATDEQGHSIELAGFGEPGDIESTKAPVPYSFVLRVPEGAHELNLVVAVNESRFLEFLAKPDQVKE
jgi:RNA polymerase sigma factor (sigma-70 family)